MGHINGCVFYFLNSYDLIGRICIYNIMLPSILLNKTFADNLLTPMLSKMTTSFFLQSKIN